MDQISLVVVFNFPFVGHIPYVDRVVVVAVGVDEFSMVVASVVLNRHVAGMMKGYCHTVGELIWLFCVWSQLLRIARVATGFSFIQYLGKVKRIGKTFDRF